MATPFTGAWGTIQLALTNVVVQSIPNLAQGSVPDSALDSLLADAQTKSQQAPGQGEVVVANDTTRSAGGTATAAVAVAGPGGKEPGRIRGGRRRGVTERQRPLWLLLPGGMLMTLIILIPLAMAVYISLTDLDQYTLRRWLQAPFIGLAELRRGVQRRGCRTRSGSASRSR